MSKCATALLNHKFYHHITHTQTQQCLLSIWTNLEIVIQSIIELVISKNRKMRSCKNLEFKMNKNSKRNILFNLKLIKNQRKSPLLSKTKKMPILLWIVSIEMQMRG